jgi:hypothetical protein
VADVAAANVVALDGYPLIRVGVGSNLAASYTKNNFELFQHATTKLVEKSLSALSKSRAAYYEQIDAIQE